jgi:putative membrane protein
VIVGRTRPASHPLARGLSLFHPAFAGHAELAERPSCTIHYASSPDPAMQVGVLFDTGFFRWLHFAARQPPVQRFLVRLILTGLSVLAASYMFAPRIRVDSVEAALLFALVLGLGNAVLRPILLLLTLPLNLLTLGLFTLVVNAIVFWIATVAPVGVSVSGFDGAFLGALTVSVVSLLAGLLIRS